MYVISMYGMACIYEAEPYGVSVYVWNDSKWRWEDKWSIIIEVKWVTTRREAS